MRLTHLEMRQTRAVVRSTAHRQVGSQFDRDLLQFLYCQLSSSPCGQVAQLVERGPEKAGVGGSIPSLATIFSITYVFGHHPNTFQYVPKT